MWFIQRWHVDIFERHQAAALWTSMPARILKVEVETPNTLAEKGEIPRRTLPKINSSHLPGGLFFKGNSSEPTPLFQVLG